MADETSRPADAGRAPLTALQEKVLAKFKERAGASLPAPTYRELCAEFGWKSTRAAAAHVEALVRKGYLRSGQGAGRPGAFVQTHTVDVEVRDAHDLTRGAGRGAPIPVPKYQLPTGGEEAFVFSVPDESMSGAGVEEADLLVVRVRGAPRAGDLVVVVEDAVLAVRRLEDVRGQLRLCMVPSGSSGASRARPFAKATLRGTVVSLMRNYEARRAD